MEAAIIVLAVFSVPLTAIVSSTWLKAKRLDVESGGKERLLRLERENADLRRRMEVLESIAIDSRGLPPMSARDVGQPGLLAAASGERVDERADRQLLAPRPDEPRTP